MYAAHFQVVRDFFKTQLKKSKNADIYTLIPILTPGPSMN